MAKVHIPESLRSEVRERARGRCEYCGITERYQVATFACDHCVPESRGGPTTLDNLAWACPRCNGSKAANLSALDPESGDDVPLFNPRQDAWPDHFRWSADGLAVEGLTPTGRTTIAALKMNRPKMKRIRGLMIQLGLHPPPARRTT